jgi:hypothetical protein
MDQETPYISEASSGKVKRQRILPLETPWAVPHISLKPLLKTFQVIVPTRVSGHNRPIHASHEFNAHQLAVPLEKRLGAKICVFSSIKYIEAGGKKQRLYGCPLRYW